MFDLKAYLTKGFGLTETEWGMLEQRLEEVRFPKGEHFIKAGKVCRRSGFIMDGVGRYFAEDREGNTPTCYFSFEGHYIVDPFNYREQTPSTINLVSVTDCTLMTMSFEQERELLVEFPRWREITTMILLEVAKEFANQKTMMSLSAAERYAYFVEHYPSLALRVPLQYVASYLGIAQPSLSRLRKNLSSAKRA